jgi:tetratricopeptide (TPR) repeat protein
MARRPLFALLCAFGLVAVTGVPGVGSAARPPDVVSLWIEAVLQHQPGKVDEAARDIAAASPETFETVAARLRAVLVRTFPDRQRRNDVRRRGAMLHADIALLLPEKAAAFVWKDGVPPFGSVWQWDEGGKSIARRGQPVLEYSNDGRLIARVAESGHWSLASWLLRGIEPDPSSDEFVRLWSRAVAATFVSAYALGSATHHLRRALEALPDDPMLLFYAGMVHDGLASPRFPRSEGTAPASPRYRIVDGILVPLESGSASADRDFWQTAERMYRKALRTGAPEEARIRLGRVLGRLGQHAEAVKLLETAATPGDARLAYLHALFIGAEYTALGRAEDALPSLELAAALFPTAQTPLVALANVWRRVGDRVGARRALDRLVALPQDASARTDPWWDYYRSGAADAETQLREVRAWFDRHPVQ